jgi:hypothetical protein
MGLTVHFINNNSILKNDQRGQRRMIAKLSVLLSAGLFIEDLRGMNEQDSREIINYKDQLKHGGKTPIYIKG